MQPKKSEKADLSKNSSLYFVIGLSLILLISWQAIEWRTYEKVYAYEALNERMKTMKKFQSQSN